MNPRAHPIVAGLLRAALATALLSTLATPSRGDDAADELRSIWNDPFFKRQFIASYGFNAEIEPRVTQEEITILEKVRPLMAEKESLAKAEETLRARLKADSSAVLDFTLGGVYFQQDKMTEALDSYQRAVTKFPSFQRAWRNLGLIAARNANYDSAIAAFTRMIELGGGDAYSYGLLGFAHAAKQDYQPAEQAYRMALLLQPDYTEWRLGLTRCVLKQEKFEDVAALSDVLIARFPDKVDFWLIQAQAFLSMKQPLKAAENLEAVDRLGKATVDSLHTLGDIYLSESLFDLAARAYVRAIEVDHNQPPARALKSAELLSSRGANAQARTVVTQIAQVWEKSLDAVDRHKILKLEARLSMAEGGGTEETASLLGEIIKLDPLDGEALLLLGQHHARHNEPDRAMFYYERAASVEAFEATAKFRHAQVLVGLQRYKEALPLLRRVQELKPRDEIARFIEQVERNSRAANR